jgi:glucosamine-6-phosphate deaminase
MSMHIEIFDEDQEAAQAAAERINRQLESKPTSVLALPTGGSPRSVYRHLVAAHRAGRTSWSEATCFNLDEYLGLSAGDPRSYRSYMREALFDHVDCPPDRQHIPDGTPGDPEAEAAAYERAIRAVGGIDLLLLGLGHNGHVAFNEPGSSHASRTRTVMLDPATVAANARFFADESDVPQKAISMGIGTILEARHLLLLVTGATKAEALRASLEGPVTISVPGSALQRHARLDVLADREAARLLSVGSST